MFHPPTDGTQVFSTKPKLSRFSKARRLVSFIWYGLLVIFISLVVLEVLLHIVNRLIPLERPAELANSYRHKWLEGDGWLNGETRLYTYKPNSEGRTYGHPFRVNRWGFRGRDFLEREKEGPRTFRIMILGDSLTSGIGVAEEDRYTDILEKKLRERYPSVKLEVINLGVQGFETVQEEKIMQRLGTIVAPNLVIVGFYRNDPNITYDYYLRFKMPIPGRVRPLLERLIIFRLLEPYYDGLYRWTKNIPTHEHIAKQAYNPESRDWKLFEQSVRNIAKWAINHTGQPPLAVYLRDDTIASKDREYQQVRDTFVKYGFVWCDTDAGHYQPVSRFEAHPNEESNWWYAEALLKTIVQRNLIPAESPNTDASQ